MGDTDHISVHWLSSIVKVQGFTGPCPFSAGGSLWKLLVSVWNVSWGTPFQNVLSFHSPACHIQSFAVLHLLVSAFPTSVASVLQEWKLPTLSTRFRTHSMAPIAPMAVITCTRLCRLFTLLTLWFSILDIVHFCSLLHPSKCCYVETSSLAISITQFNLTLCPSFTILALILSLASPLMIVSLSTCSLASPS